MTTRLSCLSLLFLAVQGLTDTTRADDVQVNSNTLNNQLRPSLAFAADGDFVVAWDTTADISIGPDDSDRSIQAQRFAVGGSPVAGEFQVNSYTPGRQEFAVIASAADGDFVIIWTSDGSPGTDSDQTSVQGQRFASDGSPTGAQFQVNSMTTRQQARAAVAMDMDGDFIVAWQSDRSFGTDTNLTSIQARRFASDGTPLASEMQVNTFTTGVQSSPQVASDSDGDFVVVWESNGSSGTDSDSYSIQGQRYASDGAPVGGQFQVNTYVTSFQRDPSVAMDPLGNFLVVWSSNGSDTDTSATSVQGQRYAADGSQVGGQFQINTYTTQSQAVPWAVVDAAGDFVVVWISEGSNGTDTDSFSIQGQRFASDGSTIGSEFQVNTYTTGAQSSPRVAANADAEFVAVWDSNGSAGSDTDLRSIQMSGAEPVPVELISFSVE